MTKPVKKPIKRAKHPRRSNRLRKTVKKTLRLLHEDPVLLGKAIEAFGHLMKKGHMSPKTFYRILNAPFSHTTFKKKIRDFVNEKINLEQLMESVDAIYSRRVPDAKIDRVIRCREGQFYSRVLKLAMAYGSPKSLVTEITLRRMRYLRRPKEEIAEAEKIKWGIHQHSSGWFKAERRNDRKAMRNKRQKIRALEHALMNKFAKKL